MRITVAKKFIVLLFCFSLAAEPVLATKNLCIPEKIIPGIGVSRMNNFSDLELLKLRIEELVGSREFSIFKNPQALEGLKKILSPRMQEIFTKAFEDSGFPKEILEAISWVESNGDPNAKSPTGPKGILQIAKRTGREMGLEIKPPVYKKIKVRQRSRRSRSKVRKVLIRHAVDQRLNPSQAIPKAANYLKRLSDKFGQDNAIAAYHCGEGCLDQFIAVAKTLGVPPKYPEMFFADYAFHKPLTDLITQHMQSDWSPLYWFTIQEAMRLIKSYREDPKQVTEKFESFHRPNGNQVKITSRLELWQKLLPTPTTFANLGERIIPTETRNLLLYAQFEMEKFGVNTPPIKIVGIDFFTVTIRQPKTSVLETILQDMAWNGYLTFKAMDNGTIKICPAPSRLNFFREIYTSAPC